MILLIEKNKKFMNKMSNKENWKIKIIFYILINQTI